MGTVQDIEFVNFNSRKDGIRRGTARLMLSNTGKKGGTNYYMSFGVEQSKELKKAGVNYYRCARNIITGEIYILFYKDYEDGLTSIKYSKTIDNVILYNVNMVRFIIENLRLQKDANNGVRTIVSIGENISINPGIMTFKISKIDN